MEKEKSFLESVFKVGCTVGGILLAGYVISEVAKEYDATVDENNRLRKFIDDHDFYKRNNAPSEPKTKKSTQYVNVGNYINDEGREVSIKQNPETGMKVYEFGRKVQTDEGEKRA